LVVAASAGSVASSEPVTNKLAQTVWTDVKAMALRAAPVVVV
jgi:hypothetical protein